MQGIDVKRLIEAFSAGSDAPVATAEAALARQLTSAHTEDVTCPTGARHRAYALFEQMPESLWETVARVVFDSWSGLAPAARSLGTERLLRFEAGLGAIDVQIGRDPIDDMITLAVAVEGMTGIRVEAHVVVNGGSAGTARIPLDEDGTGSARLSADGNDVVVIVRDEDGEVLRTPALPTR